MNVVRSRLAAASVVLVLGSISSPSLADTATMTRYFDGEARRAYQRLRYREALEYFLLVERATPSPQAAYNVAVTADAAGDDEILYAYLRKYLDSSDDDEARRKDALRRIAAVEKKLALVTVQSDPPGASVFVDQRAFGIHGVTPCTVVVEPGERLILLELDGHHGETSRVVAAKGEERATTMTLRPKTGQLRLYTSPEDAPWVVLHEGREVARGQGGEPVDLPVGAYRVRIEPSGHKAEEGNVFVSESATAELSLTATALPPKTGRLLVSTGGVAGELFLDGKKTASTPATVDTVPVGDHTLEVRAKGRKTWRGSVTIREGKTSFVEATLGR